MGERRLKSTTGHTEQKRLSLLVSYLGGFPIRACVNKLRVGVIYGGRSGEHEVSLASAAAVFKNLDPQRYEGVPIKIEKDGRWTLPSRPPTLASAADVIAGRAEICEPGARDASASRIPAPTR